MSPSLFLTSLHGNCISLLSLARLQETELRTSHLQANKEQRQHLWIILPVYQSRQCQWPWDVEDDGLDGHVQKLPAYFFCLRALQASLAAHLGPTVYSSGPRARCDFPSHRVTGDIWCLVRVVCSLRVYFSPLRIPKVVLRCLGLSLHAVEPFLLLRIE